MSSELLQQRVAILEDNSTNRDRWASLVTVCGGSPIVVNGPAPILGSLGDFFRNEQITLLMSDHHLFEQGDYAGYYGAAAVAEAYKAGIGGILVTDYEQIDSELSLRKHRRWLPTVLHSTAASRINVTRALLRAEQEVRNNNISMDRAPFRTIMTVRRIEKKGVEKVVKVIMSQWNAEIEVGFPLDMVPPEIRAEVAPGTTLIAQVNIEAERAEDLYFDEFELPHPDVISRAQSLFNRN